MDSVGTITSWQQAFEEHRIPATRTIGKQLTSSATRDKEKLRALVGGSYRELLATAESIVILDAKTKTTEEHLSTMGHSCRPPNPDKLSRVPAAGKVALVELRLLQRCCSTLASALRQQRLLQCAQLLVVSRLLLKSIGEYEIATKSLELLKEKVSILRRQLMRQVDAKLVSPLSQIPELIEAVCSHCLVTSVSSDDALAHLRQLRLEKIRRQLHQSSRNGVVLLEALQYQIVSLQTFGALAGRHLAEAMTNLQKRPILADPTLRSLESLDIDRTISLISSDIQLFVPYFKRTALSSEELQTKLKFWSAEATRSLVEALVLCLRSFGETSDVLDFRKRLYTLLLPSYFSTPGSADMHDQINTALSSRLQEICSSQTSRLEVITSSLTKHISGTSEIKPLWDSDIVQSATKISGARLAQQVKNRHAGHHAALVKATKSLDKWVISTKTIQASFTEASKIRWNDLLEEPDDDDDDAEDIVRRLSQRDSENYIKFLQDSLRRSLAIAEANFADAAAHIGSASSDVDNAVALLRSVRMSVAALRNAFPDHQGFDNIQSIIPRLHELVAEEVVRRLSETIEQKKKPHTYDIETLPEDMPSPRAFSTLRRLCEVMFDLGGADLWSTAAVGRVKALVYARVLESEHKSAYIYRGFDEAYLQAALIENNLAGSRSVEKQAKAAQDYWNRTKLLFGLLS